LVFYSKQTPLNISKLSHLELQFQQYYLGKRYSVNKKIARNRKFHGIGQESEKSLKSQISLVSLSQKSGSLALDVTRCWRQMVHLDNQWWWGRGNISKYLWTICREIPPLL